MTEKVPFLIEARNRKIEERAMMEKKIEEVEKSIETAKKEYERICGSCNHEMLFHLGVNWSGPMSTSEETFTHYFYCFQCGMQLTEIQRENTTRKSSESEIDIQDLFNTGKSVSSYRGFDPYVDPKLKAQIIERTLTSLLDLNDIESWEQLHHRTCELLDSIRKDKSIEKAYCSPEFPKVLKLMINSKSQI